MSDGAWLPLKGRRSKNRKALITVSQVNHETLERKCREEREEPRAAHPRPLSSRRAFSLRLLRASHVCNDARAADITRRRGNPLFLRRFFPSTQPDPAGNFRSTLRRNNSRIVKRKSRIPKKWNEGNGWNSR